MVQKSREKNSDEFSLYNKIKDFNSYIRLNVANCIPSVHRDVRIHLLDECYSLVSLLFYATYNKGNVRMKYLNDLRVKLSLIDYLLTDMNDYRIIKSKTMNVAISQLATIKNMAYGWILNEEKEKK